MDQTSKILVEGNSEMTVLPRICHICRIEHNFSIESKNSLNELKKALKTLIKSTNTLRKLWVILPIAESIVNDINNNRTKHPGVFKEVHKSKATIHTWLAWHDAPGESLSVAVQKRLFATDKDLCVRFANWLSALNPSE